MGNAKHGMKAAQEQVGQLRLHSSIDKLELIAPCVLSREQDAKKFGVTRCNKV
jgi:hypothetical protein